MFPRPPHHQRHAERAFPVRVLLAAEGCHRRVRPGVHVGPVVGRVHHDRVLGDPEPVEQVEELADVPVVVEHRVVIGRLPAAGLPEAPPLGVCAEVHVRGVHPAEERLAPPVLTPDEVGSRIDELVVTGLHALARQRSRVLDPLHAHAAPARVLLRIVLVRRPALQHSTRTEALPEPLEAVLFGVVRVLGLLLGVQVVEVSEELVEPVHCREELVLVPQVVLAELPCRVALLLEQLGDRRIPGLQPHRRSGQSDLAEPGAEDALPSDERGRAPRCSSARRKRR